MNECMLVCMYECMYVCANVCRATSVSVARCIYVHVSCVRWKYYMLKVLALSYQMCSHLIMCSNVIQWCVCVCVRVCVCMYVRAYVCVVYVYVCERARVLLLLYISVGLKSTWITGGLKQYCAWRAHVACIHACGSASP
jgi:hypothetical protein